MKFDQVTPCRLKHFLSLINFVLSVFLYLIWVPCYSSLYFILYWIIQFLSFSFVYFSPSKKLLLLFCLSFFLSICYFFFSKLETHGQCEMKITREKHNVSFFRFSSKKKIFSVLLKQVVHFKRGHKLLLLLHLRLKKQNNIYLNWNAFNVFTFCFFVCFLTETETETETGRKHF